MFGGFFLLFYFLDAFLFIIIVKLKNTVIRKIPYIYLISCVDFMECKLQAFKCEGEVRNSGCAYRFAVVDSNKSKRYPANFICMLPIKLSQRKSHNSSQFSELFGEKSLELALKLLNNALKTESDVEVRVELERRIKLIDPKQVNTVKCSQCKKTYQPHKIRKYRKNLCSDCLKTRYVRQNY